MKGTDDTVEREQSGEIVETDESFAELFSVLKEQMELMKEQKVVQTDQMDQIHSLIGDVDRKFEEISKRQDRLEMRQRAVEAELAAVKGEFEKSDQNRQNNMSIKVECYEEKLDALENRLERLAESLKRFQIEVEQKLKEGVLEELLKETSTSPRRLKGEPVQEECRNFNLKWRIMANSFRNQLRSMPLQCGRPTMLNLK